MAPATRLVALLTDRPALGLRRGDVGTVVHTYGSGNLYEVEFINHTGGGAASRLANGYTIVHSYGVYHKATLAPVYTA